MSDDSEVTPTKGGGAAGLTESEINMMVSAFRHIKDGKFEFDFAAVAEDLGMKDEKSVRARWNTIKRTKLNADAAPAGGVDKTSATKKKVTPKKTLAEKPTETEAKVTPTKKRGRKSNVEKALELVAAANAEEAETKEAEQEEVAEKVDEKMDTAIKAETEDDAAEKEDSMTD